MVKAQNNCSKQQECYALRVSELLELQLCLFKSTVNFKVLPCLVRYRNRKVEEDNSQNLSVGLISHSYSLYSHTSQLHSNECSGRISWPRCRVSRSLHPCQFLQNTTYRLPLRAFRTFPIFYKGTREPYRQTPHACCFLSRILDEAFGNRPRLQFSVVIWIFLLYICHLLNVECCPCRSR